MKKKQWLLTLACGSMLMFGGAICSYAEDMAPGQPIEAVAMPTQTEQKETTIKDKVSSILQSYDEQVSTRKQKDVYIPKGTKIPLQLTRDISSKTLKDKQQFTLKTTENLIVNDVVVIPKGTECQAYVVKARKNGAFGRKGVLDFNIPSVKTVNGVDVPLDGYITGSGHSDGGAVAVAAAVSLLGGFFMKGTNISYPEGQIFITTVSADTDLGATNENLAEVMDLSKPHGTSITVNV